MFDFRCADARMSENLGPVLRVTLPLTLLLNDLEAYQALYSVPYKVARKSEHQDLLTCKAVIDRALHETEIRAELRAKPCHRCSPEIRMWFTSPARRSVPLTWCPSSGPAERKREASTKTKRVSSKREPGFRSCFWNVRQHNIIVEF
jgi:hypothetical protein